MKRILILSILIFALVFSVSADEKPTIAIMDVAATNTSDVKSQVIYEYIVDVVNRADRYTIVERSALQAALKEMEISSSGMVDDSTAAEIGKLAGAKFILISNLIVDDGITYLSSRIVEVETGQVSNTAMLQKGDEEYIASLANRTISQLLGEPEVTPETVEKGAVEVEEDKKEDDSKKKEEVVKVEEKKTDTKSTVAPTGSGFSVSAGIVGIVPFLDDAEIFDIGYGLTADLNYMILPVGSGGLSVGLGSGIFLDKASVEKGVIYPYNMMSIPFSLNAKYRMNIGKIYISAKVAGGATLNMFVYTETAPTEETTVITVNPAIFPGISAGYNLTEKIGFAVFCDWSMTFFKTYPYTALNAGLAVDLNL